MFDVGFSELVVIAVVALIVIGPERLPKVARTAGYLLGRARRYVDDVKSDINREIQLDELKKLQSQLEDSARRIEEDVAKEMQSVEQAVSDVAADAADAVKLPAAEVEPSPTGPDAAVLAAPTPTDAPAAKA